MRHFWIYEPTYLVDTVAFIARISYAPQTVKIFNLGSLNIDHVYEVPHFTRAGETLSSRSYRAFAGGKGLNQSVALAKAGAQVFHAGKIGRDGTWLADELKRAGVDASCVLQSDIATGHAIIQVTPEGENSILLYGGANQSLDSGDIARALEKGETGDILLLQNEVNSLADIMREASKRGLRIALNPAPFTPEILDLPLDLLSWLILNEVEGRDLTGCSGEEEMINSLSKRFPRCAIVLTLGAKGCIYHDAGRRLVLEAEKVKAVDSTAAGDTFIGYFLAEISRGQPAENALAAAGRAAAICVTRKGAAASVPFRSEVPGLS